MKKTLIFTAILALVASVGLVAPSAVFAQYYYGGTAPYSSYVYTPPTYGSYGTTYGACTNLTSGLYKGLRDVATGGQISALQSFLISQGYLRVAPTGYFGALTAQALVQYQYAHGLIANGTADAATRASIQSVSCGYQNGYYNNYNYNSAPVLNSLSATSGFVGSSVTIYGSGFDYSNNTVNFGGTTLRGIPSYQGTALAFTVPQIYNSYNSYNTVVTYYVSVTTSHGTSNSLSFSVNSGGNCYNYGYNYNNCYNNGSTYNQGQLYLSSILPSSARVGTQVTLNGSGFSPYGNTIHFGNGGTMNLASLSNGTMLYYTIPSFVSACDITGSYGTACPMYAQQIAPGTYPVYVSNAYGQTSTIYFTVTY